MCPEYRDSAEGVLEHCKNSSTARATFCAMDAAPSLTALLTACVTQASFSFSSALPNFVKAANTPPGAME